MVSFGRPRITRLLIRLIILTFLVFTFFQIRHLWFYSPYHYSQPQNGNYDGGGGGRRRPRPVSPPRTQSSIQTDLQPYWINLTASLGLDPEIPVFVRRIRPTGGLGVGVGVGVEQHGMGTTSTGTGTGLLKVRSSFLGAHGFTRPKLPASSQKQSGSSRGSSSSSSSRGRKKGGGKDGDDDDVFRVPLGSPLVVKLPDVSPAPAGLTSASNDDKHDGASSSSSSASSSSSVLLGTVCNYPDVLSFIPAWTAFLTTTTPPSSGGSSSSSSGGGDDKNPPPRRKSVGASLLVALENASPEQVVEVRDLLWQNGIADASVFAPVPKTDTDKGSAHAQLFQQMMMVRFGRGELGAAASSSSEHHHHQSKKKWYGIIDPHVMFTAVELGGLAGLTRKLDEMFGFVEGEGERWYLGFPTEEGDWKWQGQGQGQEEKQTIKTYGGGAVLLSESVLDTAGQLMCFQGGGKGVKVEDKNKPWDQMLHECLTDGDRDLKLQALVGEGGYKPGQDQTVFREKKPLVAKLLLDGHRGKKEGTPMSLSEHHYYSNMPSAMVFRDHWVLSGINDHHHQQQQQQQQQQDEKGGETGGSKEKGGMEITNYPAGLEVKKVSSSSFPFSSSTKEDETGATEASNKISDRIVLHAPFPPETGRWRKPKKEKLVWTGHKKTWKLAETEIKELDASRREVWQAYINKKGDIREEGEEKSDVDSVIILIWEMEV